MNLAYPWLMLLLPLPWLLKPWLSPKVRHANLPRLPLARWYQGLPGVSQSGKRFSRWRNLIWLLCWALLVLAAARPQIVAEQTTMPDTGRDLMLVVDISPSMMAQDMVIDRQSVSRLDAVKQVGTRFIEQRAGDRLGLIVFSTTAHVYAPLTFDHETVKGFLNDTFIGMAGRATAIGDALGLAVRYLEEHGQEDAAIILLTDGENNAGELTPEMATEVAASKGFRTYAVGVGSPETGQRRGFLGMRGGDEGGVDIELLQHIAQTTGGAFFMARDAATLDLIYEEIHQLEAIDHESGTYFQATELYHWPLAGAALAMGALLFPTRREIAP